MPELGTIVLLLLVSAGAAFVQRVSGFGLGIVAMLFFPYFMPSQAASAVAGLISCVGSSCNALRYRSHVRFRLILPLLCAALVAIPLAVHFSAAAPEAVLKRLLGVVLVLLSVYFLFFSKKIHMKPTAWNGALAGFLGGTLSGLFSTGGPPAVLYLIHATEDNLTYFAAVQAYFALTNIYSAVMRAINGILTREVLMLAALGILGWWVGDRLGAKVFDRLDPDRLRRIIYIGMIVSGVLMLF